MDEYIKKLMFHDRILNDIPGAVFYTDMEGRYLWCNKHFEVIVGLPGASIIGRSGPTIFDSEKDPFLDTFDRLPDTGEWVYREAEIVWTDKRPRHFMCHLTRSWEPETKKAYYTGFLREVTERKKAQLSLMRANRALRTLHEFHRLLFFVEEEELLLRGAVQRIVESGYSMAWLGRLSSDENGTVVPVATSGFMEEYTNQLGIALADPVRSKGPTGQALKSMVPSIIRDIETDNRVEPWRGQALQLGFRSIASLPFQIEEGEKGALTVYSREQTAFDDEEMSLLQRLTEDLAIAIRTIRLKAKNRRMEEEKRAMEEQLVRAQKVEVVGTMAGGMAHDFNNLLNVIRGYTQLLLREKNLTPGNRDDLKEIDRTVEEAAGLTRQILLLGKQTNDNREEVDINERVDSALNLFQRLSHPQVQIHFNRTDPIPPLLADPVQINQILLNLLINANDAITPPGSIYIQTELVHFDQAPLSIMGSQPGDYVRVVIEDTGAGMDEGTRKRVFDPFFTTKVGGKGTGLGLAVTIAIVNHLKGWISLYSEPGKGSSFKLHFRAHTSEQKPLPVKTFPEHPGFDPRGKEILYVDDDPGVRAVTSRMLQEIGYRVTVVEDPLNVISQLEKKPEKFDLILSDVVMPGISGLELARKIRLRWPGQKILLCSGYTGKERRPDSNTFPFLQKPYDLTSLERSVALAILGKSETTQG